MADTDADRQEKEQWFVLNCYTKSQRQVEELFDNQPQFTLFVPKKYDVRNYYGRRKRELVPLINGMLFVRAMYKDLNRYQQRFSTFGFATIVKEGRRTPLVVRDFDMQNFIRVASHYEEDLAYFRPDELPLKVGEYVRIIGGVFDGAVGEMIRLKGKRSKRLVVRIPQIMAVAATQIEPEFIQVITKEEFAAQQVRELR